MRIYVIYSIGIFAAIEKKYKAFREEFQSFCMKHLLIRENFFTQSEHHSKKPCDSHRLPKVSKLNRRLL